MYEIVSPTLLGGQLLEGKGANISCFMIDELHKSIDKDEFLFELNANNDIDFINYNYANKIKNIELSSTSLSNKSL